MPVTSVVKTGHRAGSQLKSQNTAKCRPVIVVIDAITAFCFCCFPSSIQYSILGALETLLSYSTYFIILVLRTTEIIVK